VQQKVRYAIFIVLKKKLFYIKALVHSSLPFQIITSEMRKYTIKILIKKNIKMKMFQ